MAGRPLRRERLKREAEAKLNAEIAAQADQAALEAVSASCGAESLPKDEDAKTSSDGLTKSSSDGSTKSSSDGLRSFCIDRSLLFDIVSDACSPEEIALSVKQPDKSWPKEALAQIESCQRTIALLLEDTSEKISAVDTLNAAQMMERVNGYFNECEKRKRSFTVPGLAYAVGFLTRKQMMTFVTEKVDTIPGYLIARALMRIEEQRNVEILSGNGMMTGHKLDLATNFEWNDAKQKSSKDDEKQTTQITQNIVNYNSLPPHMSVDEWQGKFLQQQKQKEESQGVVDLSKVLPGK